MPLIIMFLLVLLVAGIILLSIFVNKKIILYVLLGIAVLVVGTLALNNTVLYYNSDTVSVMEGEEKFSIKIKNHKVNYEYYFSRFSCNDSIESLFNKILKQYENVYLNKEVNQITIVNKNQIYTIEKYGEKDFLGRKEYKYILSQNVISLEVLDSVEDRKQMEVPFPYVALENNLTHGNDRKLSCDFENLKQYYKDFTNVNIGDNTIEIILEFYKCIMTVNGRDIHFDIQKLQ